MAIGDDERRQALEAAIRRFGEAWTGGDTATLEAMLSPSYTHTDFLGGFQDRAAWLDYARGRSGRATRIGFREVRTRITGDVAIVTGINDLTGPGVRTADDRETLTIRFTQVWVWREGRWLREAFQATPSDTA